MLAHTSDVISKVHVQTKENVNEANSLFTTHREVNFVDEKEQILTKNIGDIIRGRDIHYYSYGNFNLVRLIVYLLKQTGPAHVFMTSYSFSQRSIEQLLNLREKGKLLSMKVIIDNRVKTMSPKPFEMLSSSFDYRCSAIHAKVALIYNPRWKISIVTSQNATDNPKMERGTIFTNPDIFNFDFTALTNEFNQGTT